MKNLKLTPKLIGSFLIVALLTAVIGFFGLSGISQLGDIIEDISTDQLPTVKAVLNMRAGVTKILAADRTLMIEKADNKELEYQFGRMLDAIDRFEKAKSVYEKLPKDPEESKFWTEVLINWENYKKSHDEFADLIKKYKDARIAGSPLSLIEEDYANAMAKSISMRKDFLALDKKLAELSDRAEALAAGRLDEAISSSKFTQLLTIILTVVIFVVSILLGLYISIKVIKNPIFELIETFNKVNSGDLRTKVEVKSKDELGTLGEHINKMIDVQRKQVSSFLNESKTIDETSENLLQISEQSANASNELNSEISAAASSSEEISASIATVSASSEEMTSSIKEIAKNTLLASKISSEASIRAEDASLVMDHLGGSSQEIGNIVKVITSIAEQTNLLALNATIEAARAGEMGKGFAVVANEVKELAKESAKATEDITVKIKATQEDIEKAIEAIKEISNINKQVNDIANTIASAVEEQTVTTSEINRNLSEAARGALTITEANTKIAGTSKEYTKLSDRVKEMSNELQRLAKKLNTELNAQYKL